MARGQGDIIRIVDIRGQYRTVLYSTSHQDRPSYGLQQEHDECALETNNGVWQAESFR